MDHQRYRPHIVSPYFWILQTKPLALIFLVILLNLPFNPVCAEQYSTSEEKSISRLINKYGKTAIVTFILSLRKTRITIDVNGTLRDYQGRPQLTYITPRSVLHDLKLVEMSPGQFAAWIPREIKRVEEQRLIARIEADKRLEAEIQGNNAETARRRATRLPTQREGSSSNAEVISGMCSGNCPQSVPSHVNQKIREYYARKYPDNFSMQKTLIEGQLDSYGFLQRYAYAEGVPQSIFNNIKETYARKYPDNYSMQKTLIQGQVESFRFLINYTYAQGVPQDVFNRIKKRYEDKYPYNFSMQKTLIQGQVKSYLELYR